MKQKGGELGDWPGLSGQWTSYETSQRVAIVLVLPLTTRPFRSSAPSPERNAWRSSFGRAGSVPRRWMPRLRTAGITSTPGPRAGRHHACWGRRRRRPSASRRGPCRFRSAYWRPANRTCSRFAP